jgi:hypothetical protein
MNDTPESTSRLSDEVIISNLRFYAARGATIRQLVDLFYTLVAVPETEDGHYHAMPLIVYFRQAFFTTIPETTRICGLKVFHYGRQSDGEVDSEVRPHVQKTRPDWEPLIDENLVEEWVRRAADTYLL